MAKSYSSDWNKTKLKVGETNSPLEHEADSFANRMMQTSRSWAELDSSNYENVHLHHAPHVDGLLDAIGANGATVGSDIFLHSTLTAGSHVYNRVLAHEIGHARQGRNDGVIRRSPKTKAQPLPKEDQFKMLEDVRSALLVGEDGEPDYNFRAHTTELLSLMSNEAFKMYVGKLKQVTQDAKRYAEHGQKWKRLYKALVSHYDNAVMQVLDVRTNATNALNNWSSYLTATQDYSDTLASISDDGIRNQKDGFTLSQLIGAQHRCVFLNTWRVIQEYVEAAYFGTTAPAVTRTELRKYGYIEAHDAAEFMKGGSGTTETDFLDLFKYFPLEAAKLLIQTESAERFAIEFGKLVDEAVLGVNSIDATNGKKNEYTSELSAMTTAKTTYLSLRNDHDNRIFLCIPETGTGFFAKVDYSGLNYRLEQSMDESLIKSFDGDKANLTGIGSDIVFDDYLESGL